MESLLRQYTHMFYVALRIVAGLLFACHGAQKLLGFFGGLGGQSGAVAPLWSLLGLAGVLELLGGVLIAAGVLTSYAALIASGEMAVAYFTRHQPRSFWPLENGGELAVLYCFLFLYIAAHETTRKDQPGRSHPLIQDPDDTLSRRPS